jgi:hypothetical protein
VNTDHILSDIGQDTKHLFVLSCAMESLESTTQRYLENGASDDIAGPLMARYESLASDILCALDEPYRSTARQLFVEIPAPTLFGVDFAVTTAVAVLNALNNAGRYDVQHKLQVIAARAALSEGENTFKMAANKSNDDASQLSGVYL